MTPDDIAFPASQAKTADDKRTYEGRARQNVIFEFGYFAGRLGRGCVCCIIKAGVVFPSDLNGFVYKELKESIEEIGYPLIKELQDAGLKPAIGSTRSRAGRLQKWPSRENQSYSAFREAH